MLVVVNQERELQILTGLADGRRLKEIAHENEMSVRTVETYLNSLRAKYEAKTSTHLIAIAFRENIIK